MRGLEFALNDIGLAVFTTLAPAAAFAYIALACTALFGRLAPRERSCFESWLILPLAVTTVGLIASATHLGNPGNALYVFVRTGSAALSNEVLAAVVFLGVACSYWLACIYLKGMRALRAVWLGAGVVAGLAFIVGTTRAYALPTVVTWDTVFSMANMPLVGVAGCTPLTCLVLVCSGQALRRRRLTAALAGVSAASAALLCASMLLQNADLATLRNAYGTAQELVPLYVPAVALFALCAAASLAGCLATLGCFRRDCAEAGIAAAGFEGTTPAERRAIARLAGACVVMYLGIFAVRFAFYCFHMTSGVV